jgi:dolichol kinase
MRRSADEIGATSISFGRKCLAIRHRLLTEFFPPIESARQKFERPQLPSLVRLRLGLLGLTALEPKMEEAIFIFLLGCGALLLLLLARIED